MHQFKKCDCINHLTWNWPSNEKHILHFTLFLHNSISGLLQHICTAAVYFCRVRATVISFCLTSLGFDHKQLNFGSLSAVAPLSIQKDMEGRPSNTTTVNYRPPPIPPQIRWMKSQKKKTACCAVLICPRANPDMFALAFCRQSHGWVWLNTTYPYKRNVTNCLKSAN